MSRVWTVLVDLSGTLHVESSVIPGSIEALRRLRALPTVNVLFVTNTTKESGHYLLERLRGLGFDIVRSEIFTSLTAARRIIETQNLRPLLLLEQIAMDDFEGVDTANPNAVVVGLAPSHFHYEQLNEAFRLLLEPNAVLIGIHKARYFRRADGLALGPGPFVAALEFATDKKAVVVGKPEKTFFWEALTNFPNANPQMTFMIGDDAIDDIEGAQHAGFKGILVKTGKYRVGDEAKIHGTPWAVVEDFSAAVKRIEEFLAGHHGTTE